MRTEVFHMPGGVPDSDGLDLAARIIRSGGLVAFPTETVYGLGADGLNPAAVARIFEAKGRPADNPLILHIAHPGAADHIASEIRGKARELMDAFWPGPLTLILKKKPAVPDIVTAGLDTVAVRMPRSAIALGLILKAGVPIAAPSANRSGRPSPTDGSHVLQDLNGRIDALIDAGSVEVGLESTVLDMSGSAPAILRPGGVTFEQLRAFLPGLERPSQGGPVEGTPRSPGMKYRHYAPKARVIVIKGEPAAVARHAADMAARFAAEGLKTGILATLETAAGYGGVPAEVIAAGSRAKPETVAAALFAALRRFDELGCGVVIAEAIGSEGIGAAVMNRLEKAAGYDMIDLDKEGGGA